VEAAAVPGAQPANAAEWLSLAGRAWFEAGEFDRASDCYLDAVRRRISSPAAT
jgi:cytochrome c-type biogenesis protein CcmH/NrfG